MSGLMINSDYYFRRRLEKVRETVEELMTDVPSTDAGNYDEPDEMAEELNLYLERVSAAQKEIKYFLEDLEATMSAG